MTTAFYLFFGFPIIFFLLQNVCILIHVNKFGTVEGFVLCILMRKRVNLPLI